jgi:hypothetical protein
MTSRALYCTISSRAVVISKKPSQPRLGWGLSGDRPREATQGAHKGGVLASYLAEIGKQMAWMLFPSRLESRLCLPTFAAAAEDDKWQNMS